MNTTTFAIAALISVSSGFLGLIAGAALKEDDLRDKLSASKALAAAWKAEAVSLENENAVLVRSVEFYMAEAKKRGYKPTRVSD